MSLTAPDRMYVTELESAIRRRASGLSLLPAPERKRERARALGVLDRVAQRRLVAIAQAASAPAEASWRERAAELLLLTNYGFIERMIADHTARGLEAEVLRQECEVALYDAIDRYDPQTGASFLAFVEWRMRGAVSEALRNDGRLVRLKSRAAEIANRAERAIKLYRAQTDPLVWKRTFRNLDEGKLDEIHAASVAGQPWTAQMIADLTGDRLERVQEVLPWVTTNQHFVRLDAATSLEQTPMYADLLRPFQTLDGPQVADRSDEAAVEDRVVTAAFRDQVRQALAALPPLSRRVLEMAFGLLGEAAVPSQLFAGVFVDRQGQRLSAEPSVVAAARAERLADPSLPEVRYEKATDLRRALAEGALEFQPTSAEARELYELAGVPLGEQLVQELVGRALAELRPHLEIAHEETISRGPQALEHSESARQAVRDEIKRRVRAAGGALEIPGRGRLTERQVDGLKAGKLSRRSESGLARKGQLRLVAEALALVEPESGRLLLTPGVPLAPASSAAAKSRKPPAAAPRQRRSPLTTRDLIRAGFLEGGARLSLLYKGAEYRATLLDDGRVQLEDGRAFNALSAAAEAVKGVRADPGWNSWHVEYQGQRWSLFDVRQAARPILERPLPEAAAPGVRPRLSPLAAGAPAKPEPASVDGLSPAL